MKFIITICTSVIILTGCSYSQQQQSKFDIKTIPVAKGAASVEIADFNKDGMPDIAISNAEDSSVTIFLNLATEIYESLQVLHFTQGIFRMISILRTSTRMEIWI